VDQGLLQKSYFGFRRMDVDVHAVGRNLDEEMDFRATLLDGRNAVGLDDRVRNRPILDDPAVDEDVL
jgi:hypothetical protein